MAEERFADAAQVAVFDTAFHSRLAPAAHAYAGPHEWLERGLRRYGFHGINHEYAAHRAAHLLGRPLGELRLITCHLGSGCSLAAIRDGRSVDTTMGFTPLEGVVMGTRSGSLDPGLVLHLLREEGASVDELDRVLHHGSGLRGLSGRSGDLRDVLARATAATSARRSRSMSTSTGCASTSARCSARWAGWTPSCSRRGRRARGESGGGARAVRVPRPGARRRRNAGRAARLRHRAPGSPVRAS